jgi:hypothetical protein
MAFDRIFQHHCHRRHHHHDHHQRTFKDLGLVAHSSLNTTSEVSLMDILHSFFLPVDIS